MHRIPVVSIQMVREKSIPYGTRAITSPDEVYQFAREFLGDADREVVLVLCLDTKNKVVCVQQVSVGTLNQALLSPREVFKSAILANANSIIAVHNHPSGDPTPSREDERVTEKLRKAGELLGIMLYDHVVIGDGKFVSLIHG